MSDGAFILVAGLACVAVKFILLVSGLIRVRAENERVGHGGAL